MSSLMEDLLSESSIDKLEEGEIIKGRIMEIRPTEVIEELGAHPRKL